VKNSAVQQPERVAAETPSQHSATTHAVPLDALAIPTSYDPDPLEARVLRQVDQREEQQLYAAWSTEAVVVTLLKIVTDPRNEEQRRRVEAMQAELLLSEQEKERKKRSRGGSLGEVAYRNLVAVLGAEAAESITEKIEKFSQSGGGGLQNNPSAAAQLAREIAMALQGNDTLARLGVAPAQIERAILQQLVSSTENTATSQQSDVSARAEHARPEGDQQHDARLRSAGLTSDKAAPLVLASPEALVTHLDNLGVLAARANMRGDLDTVAHIRQETLDTLADNQHLVKQLSPEDQSVVAVRARNAEVLEINRIKEARTDLNAQLAEDSERLSIEASEALAHGAIKEGDLRARFRDHVSTRLARLEPSVLGTDVDLIVEQLEQRLLQDIREKDAAVREADQMVLAEIERGVEAQVGDALERAVSVGLAEGQEPRATFDAAVEKARLALEARIEQQPFQAVVARNPGADEQLRRAFSQAVVDARDTTLQANITEMRALLLDPAGASKRDPQLMARLLSSPEGLEALRVKLESHTSTEERLVYLQDMRESLGAREFATLVDRYEVRYNRPLAFDLMATGDRTVEGQRAILRDCFGPSSELFTEHQHERFVAHVRAEAALNLATLDRERELLRGSVAATEQEAETAKGHLARGLRELGIEGLSDVASSEMQRRTLEALGRRFPGLAGKTWEEMTVSLEKLSDNDLELFSEARAEALGIDQADRFKLPLEELTREQELLRRVLPVVTGQMRGFDKSERALKELREQERSGVLGEPELVVDRYQALYGDMLGDLKSPDFESARRDARMYVNGLHGRIAAAHSEQERADLCAQRDAIEWRSLMSRVDCHLTSEKPQAQRALQLLAEFELVHGTGPTQRSRDFLTAAHTLREAVASIESFATQQERIAQAELTRSRKEDSSLDVQIVGKDQELAAAQKRVESFSFLSDNWLYKNSDLTKAEHDLSQRGAELEALKSQQRRAQAQAKQLDGVPERIGVDSRRSLFTDLVRGPEGVGRGSYLTPATLGSILERHGPHGQSKESLKQLSQTYSELQIHRNAVHGVLTDTSLARRPRGTSLSDLAIGSEVTQERALAQKLDDVVRKDEANDPSSASLQALAESVQPGSDVAKHIQVVFSATSDPRERTDRLFARLSPTDVTKVKTFLLTHNAPEILKNALPGTDPRDAAGVWRTLSGLSEEQTVPLVRTALAQGRLMAVNDLLEGLPEPARNAALSQYERLSGRTIGASLLELRPSGNTGLAFLVDLAGDPLVTNGDLQAYFPDGVVPQALQDRQGVLIALLHNDSGRASFDERAVHDLAQAEAKERATLQVALSLAVQQGRSADAQQIRSSLNALDGSFTKKAEPLVSQLSSDHAARVGLRDVVSSIRGLHTQSALSEVAGEYGTVARSADTLISLLEGRPPKVDALMYTLRESNYSQAEMHLLRGYYAYHVSRPRVSDGTLSLSGDLKRDLALVSDSNVYSSELTDLMLQGGEAALTGYDLEMLSSAIRAGNPTLATRALVALKVTHGAGEASKMVQDLVTSQELSGAWNRVKDSGSFKAVSSYTRALAADAGAQIGVDKETAEQVISAVELNNLITNNVSLGDAALAAAVIKYRNNPRIRNGLLVSGAFTKLYDCNPVDMLVDRAPALRDAWNGVFSSEPAQRVAASVAIVKASVAHKVGQGAQAVADLKLVNQALSLVGTPEERAQMMRSLDEWVHGLPQSARYTDGEKSPFVQYFKSQLGEFADADAALLEAMFRSPDVGPGVPAIPAQQLARYLSERDTLIYQMREVDAFRAYRAHVHEQAVNFHTVMCNSHSRADREYRESVLTAELARTVAISHNYMRQNQASLIGTQLGGLRDIDRMRETMRLRGVALLEDIAGSIDRGLSTEHNTGTFSDLKKRDAKIEWVIARGDAVKLWHRESTSAQEELERWNTRIEVAHTVAKVVVVVGVSFIPGVGPAGAFALATAWNVADKGFKVMYNGLSEGEALRQFAIELAFDAAFAGLGSLRIVKVVAKPGAAGAAEGVENVVKRKLVFDAFNTGARFDKGASSMLLHAQEIAAGTEGTYMKLAFEAAEKILQNPNTPSFWVLTEIRSISGTLLRGPAEMLASNLSNRGDPPGAPPAIPVPRTEPGPAPTSSAAQASLDPIVPAANTPVLSVDQQLQATQLVDAVKASLAHVPTELLSSLSGRMEHLMQLVKEGGLSLEELNRYAATLEGHAAEIQRYAAERERAAQTAQAAQQDAAKPQATWSDTPAAGSIDTGNLYAGVFDVLNSYNPWSNLLADLGSRRASFVSEAPPPAPPPVKPPQEPPVTTTRDEPPRDPPSAYGPRLAMDSQEGNSYTRSVADQVHPTAQALVSASEQALAVAERNQAAESMAEALDARHRLQLQLATSQASEVAHQQRLENAHAASVAVSVMHQQSQQLSAAVRQAEQVASSQAHQQAQSLAADIARSETLARSDTKLWQGGAIDVAISQSAPRLVDPPQRAEAATTVSSWVSSEVAPKGARLRPDVQEYSTLAALRTSDTPVRLKGAVSADGEALRREGVVVQPIGANHDAHREARSALADVVSPLGLSADAPRLKSSTDLTVKGEYAALAAQVSQEALMRGLEGQKPIDQGAPYAARDRVGNSLVADIRGEPSHWAVNQGVRAEPEQEAIRSAHEDNEAVGAPPHEPRSDKGNQHRSKLRRDAQMREAIIQQLLTQGFEASKRDKLLAVLLKLGISESEYRELVILLGEQEVLQLANAESDQARFQDGERLALTTSGEVVSESEMARELPAAHQDLPTSTEKQSTQGARSRADLYRSLQREKTSVAKGAHGGPAD